MRVKITSFYDNAMPKEGPQHIYLSVILIQFVCKVDKNYYSQVLLGKCKYIIKKKKNEKIH